MINSGTFKRLLYDKRINKLDLVRELKETADLDSIKKIFKANRSHPLIKNILSINALPKSYEDISIRKQVGFTHDLKPEIYWQLLHFEKYSDEINAFLSLKADFDRKMLIGSYDDAYNILEQIENDVCYSHWSVNRQRKVYQ